MIEDARTYKTATFGAGCFWGVEEAFSRVNGVIATAVGYMGGSLKNPTYNDVCTGQTGHAEVVQVTYDPSKVSYEQLAVFWSIHDPTQLNRAGTGYWHKLPLRDLLPRSRSGKNSKKIKRGHRDFRYIQVWKNHDCDHAGTGILPGRRIPPALLQKAWRFVWYKIKDCISRISVQFLTVPPVSNRAINLLWPLSEEIP